MCVRAWARGAAHQQHSDVGLVSVSRVPGSSLAAARRVEYPLSERQLAEIFASKGGGKARQPVGASERMSLSLSLALALALALFSISLREKRQERSPCSLSLARSFRLFLPPVRYVECRGALFFPFSCVPGWMGMGSFGAPLSCTTSFFSGLLLFFLLISVPPCTPPTTTYSFPCAQKDPSNKRQLKNAVSKTWSKIFEGLQVFFRLWWAQLVREDFSPAAVTRFLTFFFSLFCLFPLSFF